jgi:hypothetical protein
MDNQPKPRAGGRATMSSKGAADVQINLRLTRSQRDALYERAYGLGYDRLSDWIRDALLIKPED